MRFFPILLACAALACTTKPVSTLPSTSGDGVRETGGAPPASFVPTTADARATRMIDVREGLTRAQAMRTVTEALAQRFVVDVVDPRAGFAMTAWQASLMRDGVPDLRYRTRFTTRFVGDNGRTLNVQSEARWSRGAEAVIGYDAAQLDSVTNELRGKLGRRPPAP